MTATIRTLQGSVRLAFDSVEGLTDSVEKMHENIAATPRAWLNPAAPRARAHGLVAAAVYGGIRAVNHVLREGVSSAFDLLPQRREASQSGAEIRAVAALNGVCGDHLEATGNPLAASMCLMTPRAPLDLEPDALAATFPDASGHLVILVHGLALSELSWQRRGHADLGARLAAEYGSTPLYLRYNTGRHISSNGQSLQTLLTQLCASWPTPVQSISLVGHSMGGLVIRSACWYAERAQAQWLPHLRRVVCLGTPHHGSPLEMAGHFLDRAFLKTPYTAPLAFGRKRSAGIKDLRHGNLLDEDWQGHDPDANHDDRRRVVPLLTDVDYYFAAATLGRDEQDPMGRMLGDFLVRLDSATGAHRDDLRAIGIEPSNCRVFHGNSHFDLLDDESVQQQVVLWFAGGERTPAPLAAT